MQQNATRHGGPRTPVTSPSHLSRQISLLLLACLVLAGCPPRRSGRRAQAPCDSDERRVCLSRCAEASGEGGACTPGRDECSPGYRPCREGFACARRDDRPQEGVCRQQPSIFCDPDAPRGSATNLCADNSFCMRYGTEAAVRSGAACEVTPRLNIPPEQIRGVCSRGRLEGEACDGDWSRTLQQTGPGRRPVCSACAPGLVCWNGHCRRPCRPEDGGLGNCPPDEQTSLFRTTWQCVEQTGRLTPSDAPVTMRLCTVGVPHLAPCEVPPELPPQAMSLASVCAQPGDVCRRTPDQTGSTEGSTATCCGRPTFERANGADCREDRDCCGMILPGLGLVSRCCRSANEPGCRAAGQCAGCGPGTDVPCCQPDGRGCAEGQTCLTPQDVTMRDEARCIDCGGEGGPCCRRGDARTCGSGLICSDRPGETPTGDRCERCGESWQRCCPDGGCAPGNVCVDGQCRPCGGSMQYCCPDGGCAEGRVCVGGICRSPSCGQNGQVCCEGQRCSNAYLRCVGEGEGRCVQQCGLIGLPCCGTPPERGWVSDGLCFGRSACDFSFRCSGCGRDGEPPCRNASPPCDRGFFPDWSRDICRQCGQRGQPCCPEGSPCVSGLGCSPSERTCQPCGQDGQPCCANGPRCVNERQGTQCAGGLCLQPPPE